MGDHGAGIIAGDPMLVTGIGGGFLKCGLLGIDNTGGVSEDDFLNSRRE